MKKEVAVGTVIQDAQRSNHDHPRRWSRSHRAQLFDQYLELHAQGLSVRQAAKPGEIADIAKRLFIRFFVKKNPLKRLFFT